MTRKQETLEIGGHTVEVSNLEKVLYPEAGFTKGDVIRYYIDIAPVLLPHLTGRALTMKRYPDGVGKFFFYEKNCPVHRPKWLATAQVASARKKEGTRYCVVDSLPGLVWAANLADLELHVSLAKASALQKPTAMVFDLDPGEGVTAIDCARVGLEIRRRLKTDGLDSFIKTSGSKGLQLYVPLNTAANFDRTKAAARAMAEGLSADFPDTVTANMRRALRKGKVFIDWSQNDDHKTTVCAYSLRATPKPGVSTPLDWMEVSAALKKGNPAALRFSPADVIARVKKKGDLFAPLLTLKQKL
jgi:bifunctional non-homologous end joining protein LigD